MFFKDLDKIIHILIYNQATRTIPRSTSTKRALALDRSLGTTVPS